jgi:hypothetical protein
LTGYAMTIFSKSIDMLDENDVSHAESSNMEYYLADPLTAFTTADSVCRRNATELGKVDIKTFEQRSSLLWITLWKIGWSGGSIIGGDSGTSTPENRKYRAMGFSPNGTS